MRFSGITAALAVGALFAPLGAQIPRATIDVRVMSREGAPLAGVTLDLTPIGGKPITITTDSAGRASLADLEPGTARVIARKIGFAAGAVRSGLGPGANAITVILDAIDPPKLAEVRIVSGREVLARHEEFELRKLQGLTTASITEGDIRKRNPIWAWQMLSAIPSLHVDGNMGGARARSTRSKCDFRVMVDGIQKEASFNLGNLPAPGEIHGIEVFAGPARIPPQYNSSIMSGGTFGPGGALCGLIAVWTK